MEAISNAEIKFIRSLSTKKGRDSGSLFVVEGEKLVDEALKSRFKVEKVFRRDEIGQNAMSRISSMASPSPALALVRIPEEITVEKVTLPSRGLFLSLDSIRDPGNLGTIIRIADWFGIDGVFASPDTVDLFNPKVVQATMGAIFRVPFQYTDIPSLCSAFVKAGGRVCGTFLDGNDILSEDIPSPDDMPVLIVIGNESNGISDKVSAMVTDRLFIPSFPAANEGMESLNAAVATAVTVYEFRRRTR